MISMISYNFPIGDAEVCGDAETRGDAEIHGDAETEIPGTFASSVYRGLERKGPRILRKL